MKYFSCIVFLLLVSRAMAQSPGNGFANDDPLSFNPALIGQQAKWVFSTVGLKNYPTDWFSGNFAEKPMGSVFSLQYQNDSDQIGFGLRYANFTQGKFAGVVYTAGISKTLRLNSLSIGFGATYHFINAVPQWDSLARMNHTVDLGLSLTHKNLRLAAAKTIYAAKHGTGSVSDLTLNLTTAMLSYKIKIRNHKMQYAMVYKNVDAFWFLDYNLVFINKYGIIYGAGMRRYAPLERRLKLYLGYQKDRFAIKATYMPVRNDPVKTNHNLIEITASALLFPHKGFRDRWVI
ncbi:hypothetical protein GC194_03090 [bacterium]|nr:hypothetical protein [bacterium]